MKRIKYWLVSAFVFVGNGVNNLLFAESGSGNQTATQATTQLGNMLDAGGEALAKNVGRFIFYAELICVIAGAISIAWALLDRDNRQEATNQRLLKVGIGLVVAFVILLILGTIVQKISGVQ